MKKILLSISMVALAMSANAQTSETVYFQEDFEWLAPYAQAGKNGNGDPAAGNTVGTNGTESESPKLDACKVDGKTALEAMQEKGYSLVFAYQWDKDPKKPDISVYLQQNYLKFNKTGNLGGKGYQCGLVLPSIKDVPADAEVLVSFDWCPMKQGDGVFDGTQMAVIVENGEDVKEFKAETLKWEDKSDYAWKNSVISLTGAKIDAATKLTIRNNNEEWAKKTAHRFFIDNIKVYSAAAQGSAVAEVEVAEDAPVEYYNLQGVRVANPENGLFIVKQGNKVSKKIFK